MSYLDWFLGTGGSAARPSFRQGLASAEEALRKQFANDVQRANKRLAQAQEQLKTLNNKTDEIQAEIDDYDEYLEWRLKAFQDALGQLEETTLRMQYHRDADAAKSRLARAKARKSALEKQKTIVVDEIQDWNRILAEGLKKKLDSDLASLVEEEAARVAAIKAEETRLAAEAEQRAAEQAELARSAEESARHAEHLAQLAGEQVGYDEWRKRRSDG
jgi:hypothetical protein